ncbi:MAG: hypothetical protein JWP20_2529 [Roseomonas sp.]|nr:hypothetical protein [Roseomonas sp.]
MKLRLIGVAALALGLAACGTDRTERVQGGAAAGAATGAGVGAFGGPVGAAAGAVIGGGAGALTGATTSPSDVNLGRPVWSDPEVRTPLDNDTGRRSSTSTRRSRSSARPANNDGAYMGGGMVGEPGSTTSPSGSTTMP